MKKDKKNDKIKLSRVNLNKKKIQEEKDLEKTEILEFEPKNKPSSKTQQPKKRLRLKILAKRRRKKEADTLLKSKESKKNMRRKKKIEALKKGSNKTIKASATTRKKVSKPFLIFLIIFAIISFVVCHFIFDKTIYISAAFLVIFIFAILFAQILDITSKNSKLRKTIKVLSLIIIVFAILGVIAFAAFFTYVVVKSPEFDVTRLERGETTLIYDKNNELRATLGSEKREKVTYDELPEVLIDAVIATEDSRFFQHNGFDAPRFIKAAFGQLLGRDAGGASTLTMQVSKNNFTTNEVSVIRKFTDIYFSIFKIERAFTKQEIVEFYVNAPFLGSNSYGVEQAAQTYFGKNAKDMNLSEAALIAGLFQAPGMYDPNIDPEAAHERRAEVLNLMVRHGYISQEEADIANAVSIESLLKNSSITAVSEYQPYIDIAVQEIVDKTGLDPYYYPMIIYTNMDASKQEAVNAVFEGKTYNWPNSTIQAGAAAVESTTGKILAIGGGRNRNNGERIFSYATDINRQIGSTAKPLFDYGPGIEFNNWSTGKVFDDKRIAYAGGYMENFDSVYRGKMTLREALRQSINVPALEAFRELDKQQVINFVTSLGITPEIDSGGGIHEAHSIGAFNGSNPLEMAAAYAAFSNGGYYYEPYAVNKIILRDSNEELEFKSERVKVMSEATAYMITNILEMVASDTGIRYAAGTPVAAKTGTTNYDSETRALYGYPYSASPDGWIVGYSTNISMAMWTGYIENEKGVYIAHSRMVVHRNGLYRTLAAGVYDKNSGSFTRPSSVVSVTVEKNTDPLKLPSEYTPANMKITELFKRGTEPTEISQVYVPLENVTELKLSTENNTVALSWVAAPECTDKEIVTDWGDFGYFIYKDNTLIEFTQETSYSFTPESIYGTYKVVTGYYKSTTNRSSGSTVEVDPNVTFEYTGTESINIPVGATYNELTNPINVYKDGANVTANATVTIEIHNSANEIVTSIPTDVAGTYTVSYTASYLGKSANFSRTVNVTST